MRRRPQLGTYDLVAGIPLDSGRRLEREFNQSGLLAERVHRALKRGSKIHPRLARKLLFKKRSTAPQSLLGRAERELNLEGVFRVSRPLRVLAKSVLLIDDIFTTGATLEEAAKTLKQAGARRVGYFVIARTAAR